MSKMTERQQLAIALKESAVADDLEDSDDDDVNSSSKKSPSKSRKRKDYSDDDDDDGGQGLDGGDDDDDDDEEGGPAPGMVSDAAVAKRWWEGSAGFDFTNARSKSVIEEDGMQVAGDPRNFVGKLVKRSFGRGVVSFGKVVGWFPPEEDGDEELYHVLHGDGDEEDLDPAEAESAIAWAAKSDPDRQSKSTVESGGGSHSRAHASSNARSASVDNDEDDDDESARRAAAKLSVGDAAIQSVRQQQSEELSQAADARSHALASLLKKPPRYETGNKGDTVEAALRGIHFIFSLSRDDNNLARFGSDLVQPLYDVACVAPDPLRRNALQRVEQVSQKWKQKFSSLADLCEVPSNPRPDEVVDAVMGLYALERVGLEHSLKQGVAAFLRSAKFTPVQVVGFDTSQLTALKSKPSLSEAYTTLTAALNTAFFASKVGLELAPNLSLTSVCQHVRTLRPYLQCNEFKDEDDWIDQITMVFNVVHVMSNFGELRLRPSTLPHEAAFLAHPSSMTHALKKRDVHVVGELCHCLRVFGHTPPTSRPLREGLAFLVATQKDKDGSWPTRGGDDAPYTKYHAAMCATMALYEPSFRGFGPSSAELKGLTDKWARRDRREASTSANDSSSAAAPSISPAVAAASAAVALAANPNEQDLVPQAPSAIVAAVEDAYSYGNTDESAMGSHAARVLGSAAALSRGSGDRENAKIASNNNNARTPVDTTTKKKAAGGGGGGGGRGPPGSLMKQAELRLLGLLRWRKTLGANASDFDGVKGALLAARPSSSSASKTSSSSGSAGAGRSSEASRKRARKLSQQPLQKPQPLLQLSTASTDSGNRPAAVAAAVAASEATWNDDEDVDDLL